MKVLNIKWSIDIYHTIVYLPFANHVLLLYLLTFTLSFLPTTHFYLPHIHLVNYVLLLYLLTFWIVIFTYHTFWCALTRRDDTFFFALKEVVITWKEHAILTLSFYAPGNLIFKCYVGLNFPLDSFMWCLQSMLLLAIKITFGKYSNNIPKNDLDKKK